MAEKLWRFASCARGVSERRGGSVADTGKLSKRVSGLRVDLKRAQYGQDHICKIQVCRLWSVIFLFFFFSSNNKNTKKVYQKRRHSLWLKKKKKLRRQRRGCHSILRLLLLHLLHHHHEWTSTGWNASNRRTTWTGRQTKTTRNDDKTQRARYPGKVQGFLFFFSRLVDSSAVLKIHIPSAATTDSPRKRKHKKRKTNSDSSAVFCLFLFSSLASSMTSQHRFHFFFFFFFKSRHLSVSLIDLLYEIIGPKKRRRKTPGSLAWVDWFEQSKLCFSFRFTVNISVDVQGHSTNRGKCWVSGGTNASYCPLDWVAGAPTPRPLWMALCMYNGDETSSSFWNVDTEDAEML